ncbi:hypothetical protein HRI_001824900 [Hibiscus trionum]|uniref:Protein KAKU4 n=1 Tax=Hibiscus trionum TaxID=183268 RepID=A0A9W7LXJ4_HIBTR|nr:hypothetical protein HRI_001824900 [Hibiscus trionum]
MATISGASPRREPESGAMSPETPYDRPGFLNSALHNPNWISRNIFPPTRAIVTGAGRILASVLGFESSSSSSSSECSSCPDDSHDNNDEQEVSSQGVHAIEDREPQYFAGKHKAKHLIEHLLKNESFSRQECDKLTDIIKSRVVDSPSICGVGLRTLDETPERTDVEVHDFCNKAVLEAATKLLGEKKSGPDYMSEVPHGTSALNSVTLKHDVEGEVGSPVDLAKSYMQTCPPWASPSKNNTDFRFPSSVAMPLFKEEPPYSIGGNFLYSSKRKRNSLVTGSWNIQDEIRRVRYKASEEMLRNLSSSKNGWSSFPLEHKKVPDSIAANNLGPTKEDKSQGSKRPVDLAAKSASQLTKDVFHVDSLPRSASQLTKDVFRVDALPRSASLGREQNLVMQTTPSIKVEKDETLDVGQRLQPTVYIKTEAHSDVDDPDANRLKESNGSIQPFSRTNEGIAQDSQVEDKNLWALNEVAGTGSLNGFPSGSNMSSEAVKEQNHRPVISKEDDAGACGYNNASGVAAAKEKRELLYEASAELPTVNETDAAASGSQHSWSMQHEGSPEDQNTPTSKASSAGKRHFSVDKASRYNMRHRGRRR